jgi:hypothetical protein
MKGPITDAMRNDLASRGAEILEYVPNYTYLVRMSEASKSAVSALDAVSYVGLFQPAYKLATYLPATLGTKEVMIYLFRGERSGEVIGDLKEWGGEIIETSKDPKNAVIHAKVDAAKLADIARMPEVRWVEPYFQCVAFNQTAQWIGQDNVSNTRRIWYVNGTNNTGGIRLLGQGQVTGESDTGLNMTHYCFNDPAVSLTTFGEYPTHRKVIAYMQGSTGMNFGDQSIYHGTHVAGTICGNDSGGGSSSRSANCGMAPYAKHWFVDIGYTRSSSGEFPPPCMGEMFQPAWEGNAGGACRIFSQSWGISTSSNPSYGGLYNGQARDWDVFMWAHPDFLGFNAAGNDAGSGIGPPATAKDIVTVGCVQTASPNNISSFSSLGPCRDSRIKPTICAPGDPLTSPTTGTNTWGSMSGTSMATPDAAGHCALVRQYFTEGWYPTGSQNLANGFIPSAALMKAVLVCSGDSTSSIYPNNTYGFGRINLWNVLHFTGTPSNNPVWVVDETGGLNTGQFRDYTIPVLTGSPIKVALVWTDYPGGFGVNPTLVNNLDLRLTDPGATSYLGNVMTNGESQTGGSADARNVEEICRRRAPAAGNWTVRVTGTNCPMGPQPYALVVTGNLNIPASPQIIVSAVAVPTSPKSALRFNRVDSLRVTLKNIGTGAANATTGILRSLSTFSRVLDSTANFGNLAANGGTGTATFRVQSDTNMMCWYRMPFTVRWTSGSVSDNAGFNVTSNIPDSGNQYAIWGQGDNEDYLWWATALQKRGYRGYVIDSLALPPVTRPNPLVLFTLIAGVEGTGTTTHPLCDSFPIGLTNDSLRITPFLTTSYDSGGLYLQSVEAGWAMIDAAGPRNVIGRNLWRGGRLGFTYNGAPMDLEHGITQVRGNTGYFSSFTFNYNAGDTGANGTQGCDMDGIQRSGSGAVNLMRFTSQRNDTCLVGNVQTGYKDLIATFNLKGLIESGGNLRSAYADSVMHWFGVHAAPSGVESGPLAIVPRTEFNIGRPNPTTGATTFNYQLAKDVKVSLKVYNLAGQLVRNLVDGVIPAGAHETVWDGRTESGKRVSAGVYLVRFEAGSYSATKKAVVVR